MPIKQIETDMHKVYFLIVLLATLSVFPVFSQEFDELFLEAENAACGVQECEVKFIYKTCENKNCGTITSQRSCGEHWTKWHRCGGGHGNPCPSGCTRVGGALGYDYRSVDFPPRCEEKNKYSCVKTIDLHKSCQNKACGIDFQWQTGKVNKYNICRHPANGIDPNRLEQFKLGLEENSNMYDGIIDALITVYQGNDDVIFSKRFNDEVAVAIKFLEHSTFAPQELKEKVDSLELVFRGFAHHASQEEIRKALGPRLGGSEAEARARDWGVAKFKELGFKNVRS